MPHATVISDHPPRKGPRIGPMPHFTVIIPTHNVAHHIGDAIRSVLAQSWSDLTLLVIDDGSSDGTLEVSRQFHDPRVQVLRQDHQGVSSARNHGLRRASSPFVAFLDGDDRWMPQRIASRSRERRRRIGSKATTDGCPRG